MSKQKTNLSPFFQNSITLEQVFPDYDDLDAVKTWKEQNCMPPLTGIDEENDNSTAWLAYAVHHAHTKHPNAPAYDQYAFAGMVQGVYSGLFGGFGTDDERQEKIENQAIFLANRLADLKISDETKAKMLLLFLENRYFQV